MIIDHLDHIVLTVADVDKTLQFYHQVLGMQIEEFNQGRKALRFNQQKINLHQKGQEIDPKADRPTPGAGDLCFISQTPMDEIVAELHYHQIPIELGPVERTGATHKIYSVYFRDPDQNLLEVSNSLS